MSKPPPPTKSKTKNRLEWTVFGLSTVALIGVITVLVHQSVTVGEEPAHLMVRMGTPLIDPDQVRVPVSVINQGDVPAIAVVVEIHGIIAGESQSSSLDIDHVPHRSHRKGWVSFTGNEVPSNLTARVVTYMNP